MLTLKNWLNKYFGFTKREYNGLLALMVILLLISVLPYFYGHIFRKQELITDVEQSAWKELVLADEKQSKYYNRSWKQTEAEKPIQTLSLVKFDPNQIDLVTWQQLGLSLKQAQSILNYRNKGGKFYQPEDLKKMYAISAEKYLQLLPYVAIGQAGNAGVKKGFPPPRYFVKKDLVVVDLNTADSSQLDQVKGIGAAFARRIIQYRTKLGGFYKKEQLLEVFGMDSLKFEAIKSQVRVEGSNLVKIELNSIGSDGAKKHPYLTYKQLNAIVQYRKQHGKFNSIDDLKKVAILTPQNIERIAPYLTF